MTNYIMAVTFVPEDCVDKGLHAGVKDAGVLPLAKPTYQELMARAAPADEVQRLRSKIIEEVRQQKGHAYWVRDWRDTFAAVDALDEHVKAGAEQKG